MERSTRRGNVDTLLTFVQVLSGLNQVDLNYVLVHINTAALFEVAGQHTMEILMSPQQRLPQTTTLSRLSALPHDLSGLEPSPSACQAVTC